MHQVRISLRLDGGRQRDVLIRAAAGTAWGQLRAVVAAALRVPATALPPLAEGEVLGGARLRPGALLGADPVPLPAPGALQLRIEHGPAAGLCWPLTPGVFRLGRATDCHFQVGDDAVSRRHVHLRVDASGVWVLPITTTNGIWIEGRRVRAARRLAVGETLRIGRSQVRVVLSGAQPWPPAPVERPVLRLRLPNPPAEPAPAAFPVLAMLVGVLVSLTLALTLHSMLFLLLGLASPLLAAAHTVSARRQARRAHQTQVASHRRAEQEVLAAARARLAEQRVELRAAANPCTALSAAEDGAWPRIPHPLRVSVGLGSVPAGVELQRDGAAHPPIGGLRPTLTEAALLLTLPPALYICGPPSLVAGLMRWIIGQLALNHAPESLRMALFLRHGPESTLSEWEWFGWLPHADGTDLDVSALVAVTPQQQARVTGGLLRLVAESETQSRSAVESSPPRVVLCWLLADPPPADLVTARGVHLLLVDTSPGRASPEPPATTPGQAWLRVHADGTLQFEDEQGARSGVADRTSRSWAERIARSLAGRGGLRSAAGLPTDLRLLDALGLARLDDTDLPLRVGSLWDSEDSGWLLGTAVTGPVRVDLAADGPHFLVAGTTGAGKSELLRSMVAGLALTASPEDLACVLIDYKGGAAFGSCTRLPHVLGLLTDLDADLTARALTGLRAEIVRREALFASLGVSSLAEYRALDRSRTGSAGQPVPRLVIVVDEFRALAEELPDFVTGLVRLAAVGRSLGLHLVLATQRPSGAVSPEIRANITSRIALRMADVVESRDVVDCPDAAALPVHRPGRAVLRVGGGRPVLLHCVRVDVPSIDGVPVAQELTSHRLAEPIRFPAVAGPSDLDRVLSATLAAADSRRSRRPAALWQPPLPDLLPTSELRCRATGELPTGLLLGLLDDPATGRQQPIGWDPRRDGPLAVVGGPGSGRRVTLRRILHAAGGGRRVLINPDQVLGAVSEAGERAEADHGLVRTLDVDDPTGVLEACDWLTAGRISSTSVAPLLLVHDWDRLHQEWQYQRQREYDILLDRIRSASRCGLGVVLSGGRSLLGGQVASLIPTRLVLRLPDPADAAFAGLRRGELPSPWPPGRGLWLAPGVGAARHLQVGFDPPGWPPC